MYQEITFLLLLAALAISTADHRYMKSAFMKMEYIFNDPYFSDVADIDTHRTRAFMHNSTYLAEIHEKDDLMEILTNLPVPILITGTWLGNAYRDEKGWYNPSTGRPNSFLNSLIGLQEHVKCPVCCLVFKVGKGGCSKSKLGRFVLQVDNCEKKYYGLRAWIRTEMTVLEETITELTKDVSDFKEGKGASVRINGDFYHLDH